MGNLTHQTDVTGKVTEYHYDLADNIREVWDNGKKIAEYEYNADNTIKYLKNGSLYTEYAYDADRNLIGLKTLLGTDTLVDNRYTYNGNGDRLEKYQKCGTTKYSYDKMRRLAKVEYPNATEELFYDKAGNRTKRLYNGTEELYQYDKRNRLTAHTKGSVTSQYEYDNAGNLLKDDKAQYTYDAFNRNTKVETFNGNIQINHYDAEGLRHEMEENGKLVTFIYRGDEVIAEESQEDKIRYIRTSVLLASDAESARTYYHYASDEMGSITHVTDSENEEILNHYEYDAWGNLTVCEEKVQNRFRFNGQQYDPISQQYYLRARYYNPVIGRFTQEDSYNVDGLNLYAYCRNNPVSYVDPSGNICEKRANEIMERLGDQNKKVTNNEKRKLASYIRNKLDHGEKLNKEEKAAVKQLKLNIKHVASAEEYARKVKERADIKGSYSENATPYDILRGELHRAGISSITPYANAAHHIVPWNDSRTAVARAILDSYKIDYNSAVNGVFLPRIRNGHEGDAALHSGTHLDEYTNEINKRLVAANEEAEKNGHDQKIIVNELNRIRFDLLNGILKLCNK